MPRVEWPRSTPPTRLCGPVRPAERARPPGAQERRADRARQLALRMPRARVGRLRLRRPGRSRPGWTPRTSSGSATPRRRRPAGATDTGRGYRRRSGERPGAKPKSHGPPTRPVRCSASALGVRRGGRCRRLARRLRPGSCSASSTGARSEISSRRSRRTWNGWNGRSPATRTSWPPPGWSWTIEQARPPRVEIRPSAGSPRSVSPTPPAPAAGTRTGTPAGVPVMGREEGPRESPRPDESAATVADRACGPEIRGYSTRARSPRGHQMTLPAASSRSVCPDAPGRGRRPRVVPVARADGCIRKIRRLAAHGYATSVRSGAGKGRWRACTGP